MDLSPGPQPVANLACTCRDLLQQLRDPRSVRRHETPCGESWRIATATQKRWRSSDIRGEKNFNQSTFQVVQPFWRQFWISNRMNPSLNSSRDPGLVGFGCQLLAWVAWLKGSRVFSLELLLMEEILHHLACMKPCKYWDIYHINWSRIASTNSTRHDVLPPTGASASALMALAQRLSLDQLRSLRLDIFKESGNLPERCPSLRSYFKSGLRLGILEILKDGGWFFAFFLENYMVNVI